MLTWYILVFLDWARTDLSEKKIDFGKILPFSMINPSGMIHFLAYRLFSSLAGLFFMNSSSELSYSFI